MIPVISGIKIYGDIKSIMCLTQPGGRCVKFNRKRT